MQTSAVNEYRYWKVLRAIGFTMLIFLAFINIVGLLCAGLQILFRAAGTDPVTAEVGYQLFYAAGYLSAFMLPVIFLKKMIRKAGIIFRARDTPRPAGLPARSAAFSANAPAPERAAGSTASVRICPAGTIPAPSIPRTSGSGLKPWPNAGGPLSGVITTWPGRCATISATSSAPETRTAAT